MGRNVMYNGTSATTNFFWVVEILSGTDYIIHIFKIRYDGLIEFFVHQLELQQLFFTIYHFP